MANRKSTLDRLDPRIRDAVHTAIRENRATIDEIVATIVQMGGDVSRSAVGRYVKRIGEDEAKRLEEYRKAQSVAAVWVEKIGSEPEGDVGRMLIEQVRMLAVQAVKEMNGAEVDAQDLMLLGKSLDHLAKANKSIVDREASVQKLMQARLEKTVKAAEKGAAKAVASMTPEQAYLAALKQVRVAYGMVEAEAA